MYKRQVGDTVDLVQSALGDALKDLPALENESMFFTWVTTIARRKITAWRRRLRHPEDAFPPSDRTAPPTDEKLSMYFETLDAIISLYVIHPREMTVLVWRSLDRCSWVEIAHRSGVTEGAVRGWHQKGIDLLKKRLSGTLA